MAPTIVLKNGSLYLVLGSPGGPRIISSTLLTILNVIDFGMNVQEALEQPWFRTEAFQGYRYPNAVGENLVLSDRIPETVQVELKRRGHVVKTQKMLGVASMRAVVIDAGKGTLSAAAAPGSDGYALGK